MKQFIYITGLFLFFLSGSCQKEESLIFSPDFEVFVLLPAEGLGDRSFADVVYEGVEAAALDYNFKVNYIIPETFEKGETWIEQIPSLGKSETEPHLIFIAGNQYTEAVNKLKNVRMENKIVLLAGIGEEAGHLASLVYHTYAPSYIGGYVSARLVNQCRATVIEGFDAPFLKEYSAGFKAGVRAAGGTVNPVHFVSTGFSGFEMPDSAYALTERLLPANDLIFALAAGSNFGIINAARDFPGQRYVIGVDSDQSWMGLKVVTGSVIKLFEDDILEIIGRFSEGRFVSGNFYRTFEEGKTAFLINEVVLDNAEIPESLVETAIRKEQQYINGLSEK